MNQSIKIGDQVKLMNIPEWLVHDLPGEEKKVIYACLGQVTVVTDIDQYGYYWLGFGSTVNDGDVSLYTGNTFCVPHECLAAAPL